MKKVFFTEIRNFDGDLIAVNVWASEKEAQENFEATCLEVGQSIGLFSGECTGELPKNPFDLDDIEEIETRIEEGRNIQGSILVGMRWESYVGYARKFCGLYHQRELSGVKFEKALCDGNEERTGKEFLCVLLYAEDIEGLSDDEVADKVVTALGDYDKWTTWTDSPLDRNEVAEWLGLTIKEEDEL